MILQIDDDKRVRTLTLNRPEALNAFNEALYDATAEALLVGLLNQVAPSDNKTRLSDDLAAMAAKLDWFGARHVRNLHEIQSRKMSVCSSPSTPP